MPYERNDYHGYSLNRTETWVLWAALAGASLFLAVIFFDHPLPAAAAETITKLAEQRPRRRLDETVMAAMLEAENERRKHRRVVVDENQLSLFDVA